MQLVFAHRLSAAMREPVEPRAFVCDALDVRRALRIGRPTRARTGKQRMVRRAVDHEHSQRSQRGHRELAAAGAAQALSMPRRQSISAE